MPRGPSRRDFCRVAAAGVSLAAGALAGVRHLHAQGGAGTAVRVATDAAEAPARLEVATLAPSLFVVGGAPGNVVVAVGRDEVLVVNGGAPAAAGLVLSEIARLAGGRPVKTLFNTDWHAEHTGANEALGRGGATIVAHEFTRQYLSTEMTVEWQETTHQAKPPQGRPTKTFYTKGSMPLGDEQVDYGHLGQAHTDGDIYVYFRKADVLVAGDTLSVGRYPIADYCSGGWLGGLVTANRTVLDLTTASTRYVPGAGAVQPRAGMQAHHDLVATMRDRMHKMFRQGLGADDMRAAGLTKDFDGVWGNPDLFVATSYRGMWLHIRELGGVV